MSKALEVCANERWLISEPIGPRRALLEGMESLIASLLIAGIACAGSIGVGYLLARAALGGILALAQLPIRAEVVVTERNRR